MPAAGGRRGAGASRYRFVDFAARAQPGFRNRVVPIDEVEALVLRYGGEECYATIFCCTDELLLYVAEHQVDGRPSVAGYDGRVWAPFLPIDIDAHPPGGDLHDALDLARRAQDVLLAEWGVPDEALHAFFSGAKGFHLLIDTRAFGRVVPARELHRLFSRLRLELLRDLAAADRAMFDLAIGDKMRLLRLPNTRHAGSGLFKVRLGRDEFAHCPLAEILSLARAPRPLPGLVAAGLVPTARVAPVPGLVERYRRARLVLRRQRGAHPYRMRTPPATPEEALCAARLDLWRGEIEPGMRNNVAIRLASAFRLAGYDRQRTLALLTEWDRRQASPLPEAEIRAVIASAYARAFPYTYGCHDDVIRAFCPFVGCWNECADYRTFHSRSGRD